MPTTFTLSVVQILMLMLEHGAQAFKFKRHSSPESGKKYS